MKTLIIVPAYNEQENIKKTVQDVQTNLPEYDILVVNDGSLDDTGKILDELKINHIDLPVNLGLSGAVQCGYKYAYKNGYDCAIQFDGDGQHKSEYIPKMIEKIEEGYDIVIGSRFVNKKKDWSLRMIGSRMISGMIRFSTGVKINDPTSGMRMLNRKMIYDYAFHMNRKPEPDTLAYQIKNEAKVYEIQVDMNEREAGLSIYSNIWACGNYMLKTLISIFFMIY